LVAFQSSDEDMTLVLGTPRLSLRNLTPEDSAFLLELMNEPPYIANIGDRGVRTIADARRYIDEKFTASYVRHGFGLYLRRFWSRGYALEAARATFTYAQESLKLPYVHGLVSPANTRSIRLLEKLGLRYVRSLGVAGQALESHLYGAELRPT
jgi:ribosomal-protein-alanine N-acetyltransferase